MTKFGPSFKEPSSQMMKKLLESEIKKFSRVLMMGDEELNVGNLFAKMQYGCSLALQKKVTFAFEPEESTYPKNWTIGAKPERLFDYSMDYTEEAALKALRHQIL